jgi:hypothetical protein
VFEKTRDYPTAYVRDENDESLIRAIQWVLQQAKSSGGTPLLYAPGKRNISYREPISAFAKRYPVMTPQTRWSTDWRGGPVLAVWAGDKLLGEIGDNTRTTALCAVQWGDRPLAWAAATGATNLDPEAAGMTASLPSIDPVVRQGLMQLGHAVNHANALTGSMDKADAVSFFRLLVDNRLPVQPDALYAHALADGWPERGAARLREMATQVTKGGRPQGWKQQRWRPEVVDAWRQAAASEE